MHIYIYYTFYIIYLLYDTGTLCYIICYVYVLHILRIVLYYIILYYTILLSQQGILSLM